MVQGLRDGEAEMNDKPEMSDEELAKLKADEKVEANPNPWAAVTPEQERKIREKMDAGMYDFEGEKYEIYRDRPAAERYTVMHDFAANAYAEAWDKWDKVADVAGFEDEDVAGFEDEE